MVERTRNQGGLHGVLEMAGTLRIIRAIEVPSLLVQTIRLVIIVQHKTVVVQGVVMRAENIGRFIDVDHSTGRLAIGCRRDASSAIEIYEQLVVARVSIILRILIAGVSNNLRDKVSSSHGFW